MGKPGTIYNEMAQTFGLGSIPPVVQQYNEWIGGRAFGPHLPRDLRQYRGGAFGPLTPIQPVTIDEPREDTGRPEPRRWQFPVGWNMPIGVPGMEGVKLASFANLRAYADLYSVARACIEVRKQEILGLDWDITPTDLAEKQMRGDDAAYREFMEHRAHLVKFFRNGCEDRNYHSFRSWLGAALEDVLVVDALSVYIHPCRGKGKGLLGSDIGALDLLDGTTIRPLLNMRGETPPPPNPAYQQYLWGVPRMELMDVVMQEDSVLDEQPVERYRSDQLLYMPYVRRTWTPYGFPPVERAILPIAIGLKRQQYLLDFYTEGSIPGMFLFAGPEFATPQQVRQLQDTLNMLSGDIGWKWKITVLPHGSSVAPIKPPQLNDGSDTIFSEMVIMAFDVKPNEVGLAPGGRTHGMGGASLHQAQQRATERTATKPLLGWFKGLFDFVIQDICRMEHLQFHWSGLEEKSDQASQAMTNKTLISIGVKSVDEVRGDLGLPPWGLDQTATPMIVNGTGPPIMLGDLSAAGEDVGTAEQESVEDRGTDPDARQDQAGRQEAPQAAAGAGQTSPAEEAAQQARPQAATHPDDEVGKLGHRQRQPSKPPTEAEKKALLGEIEKFRNFLRHGHDPETFRPFRLSRAELRRITGEAAHQGPTHAFAHARQRARKAKAPLSRREALIRPVQARVAAELGAKCRALKAGELSTLHFVDDGVRILRDAYRYAWRLGARAAIKQLRVRKQWDDDDDWDDLDFDDLDDDEIEFLLEQQRHYLMGLGQDVLAAVALAWLVGRMAIYAASTRSVYERGFYRGFSNHATGRIRITWVAQADCCDMCDDYDGETYDSEDDLPGFPGAGDFGEFCITGDTLVWAPSVEIAFRRRYEGPIVRLTTASGRSLTCTPNHAVLIDQGWVRADLLQIGDHVVCAQLVEKVGAAQPDIEQMPAAIDEVFATHPRSRLTEGMAAAALDLNGEHALNAKVKVVPTDGFLRDYPQPAGEQPFLKLHLAPADGMQTALATKGHGARPAVHVADSRGSGLGAVATASGARLDMDDARVDTARSALVQAELTHNQRGALRRRAEQAESRQAVLDHKARNPEIRGDGVNRLAIKVSTLEFLKRALPEANLKGQPSLSERRSRPVSHRYSHCDQTSPDRPAADFEVLRNLQLRGAAQVALDEVIAIEFDAFAGYVYNLSTDSHWYLGNSIVIHNCEGGPNCQCELEYEEIEDDDE